MSDKSTFTDYLSIVIATFALALSGVALFQNSNQIEIGERGQILQLCTDAYRGVEQIHVLVYANERPNETVDIREFDSVARNYAATVRTLKKWNKSWGALDDPVTPAHSYTVEELHQWGPLQTLLIDRMCLAEH